MAVQVRREPFARMTLYREVIPKHDRKDCLWCGQPARFRYQWESDGGSLLGWSRPFCSIDCYDTWGA